LEIDYSGINKYKKKNLLNFIIFIYKDQVWSKYSPDLLEFTKFLLKKNPTQRPNASTALRHKWIIKFSAL